MASFAVTPKIKNNNSYFSFNEIMYFFDFFGTSLTVYVAGKDKQTTWIGAVLGILATISIIFLSSFLIIDLFARQQVHITYNQNRDQVPINNLTSIPMVFKLIDGAGNPIETNGLYEIDIILASYTKKTNEKGEYSISYAPQKINYTKCDLETSFGEYKNFFKDSSYIKDLFCIAPNSNNLTLFGKYADSVSGFSYINFYINKCQNATSKSICLSEKEMGRKLQNVFLSFTMMDYEINHYNSEISYKPVIKTSAFSFSSSLHKRYFFYIRQIFYETDHGFIFQDSSKQTFFQQDNYQFDVRTPGDSLSSELNFGMLSITNENKIDFYFRRYNKLQDIVAQIGGFFKGIMICAWIINYVFTRNYSSMQISNSLIDFEEELQAEYINKLNSKMISLSDQQGIINMKSSTNNVFNFHHNSSTNNQVLVNLSKTNLQLKSNDVGRIRNNVLNNIKPNEINQENKISFPSEEPSKNKIKINLNFCSLILPKIFTLGKERKILEILHNSVKIMKENLSVDHIIEKFFEIEKLKKMFLYDELKLREFYSTKRPTYKQELERIIISKNKTTPIYHQISEEENKVKEIKLNKR